MLDLSWTLGHARISYTHHKAPISLPTKTGNKTSLSDLAKSVIPPCRLNPVLFNGHLQTFCTAWKDAGAPVHYKRRIFDSTHSVFTGQFTVDFVVTKEEGEKSKLDQTLPERTTYFSEEEWKGLGSDDETPMLVCLHGLSGGSHEVYLREVVAPITASGWEACVINGRGCALSKLTTPRIFNARATWDVRQLIRDLRDLFPNRPLYAVGFSLGANILTNYLAEEGSDCVFKAAVACSNPFNLEICELGLRKTWVGREVYSRTMGRNMMKMYAIHKEVLLTGEGIEEEEVNKCRYLYDFDRVIQVPTWGYPTWKAYYRDASSADAVVGIKIPFLAINAEDDPISLYDAIPFDEFESNPYTVLCTTNWGGHLSWFGLGGKRWFATATEAFFMKIHDEVDLKAVPERIEANEAAAAKSYPMFDSCNRRMTCPLE